ncbi:MAG: hypothetical protein SFZ23_06330 [Planctomycetota bacterium]|nr:hypothetical protein [Planctomycetota bacterium]
MPATRARNTKSRLVLARRSPLAGDTKLREARRPVAAFTLIEAIMAIVIMGVAIPPLLWALREAQFKRAGPVLLERAHWLAKERLEDIIADRHSATRGYAYVVAGNYPAEASISEFSSFSRSVTINVTGPDLVSAGTGFKTVTVTVGWMDGSQSRQLALATVLTEYTP